MLADTGALAVGGQFDVKIILMTSDTAGVGKGITIEHRNAANSATVKELGGVSCPENIVYEIQSYTIGTGERIRAVVGAASAASSVYDAMILITPV